MGLLFSVILIRHVEDCGGGLLVFQFGGYEIDVGPSPLLLGRVSCREVRALNDAMLASPTTQAHSRCSSCAVLSLGHPLGPRPVSLLWAVAGAVASSFGSSSAHDDVSVSVDRWGCRRWPLWLLLLRLVSSFVAGVKVCPGGRPPPLLPLPRRDLSSWNLAVCSYFHDNDDIWLTHALYL